jgi:hypothetical protein
MGLVWAGVREGEPIERSRRLVPGRDRSTVVQVTNLGITVKDSPINTLIFVTRLDNGRPVPRRTGMSPLSEATGTKALRPGTSAIR